MAAVKVQEATAAWSNGTQSTPKVVTFPSPVTPGNVIIVTVSYTFDATTGMSGCGALFSQIQSREGSSSNFESAEIWYGIAQTAGTTVTLNLNTGFNVGNGTIRATEFSGLSGQIKATSQIFSHTSSTSRASTALPIVAGELYISVITANGAPSSPSVSDSPSAFDYEYAGSNNNNGSNESYAWRGYRIGAGAESPSQTATFGSTNLNIAVSATFTLAVDSSSVSDATLLAGSALTAVDGNVYKGRVNAAADAGSVA